MKFSFGFLRTPADAGGQAGKRCNTENSFDELVVRHRIYLCEKSIPCLGHLREVDKNIFDKVKRFMKKLFGW